MFGKKKSSDTEEENVKEARPKKEKKKKEPKPKKEKRPKKEKKEKKPKPPKKQKPPKQPKPKKPKKPKKKMNPLVLVILLLVALVIAAAGALVLMMKKQEQKEDAMYGPMYYFAEEDGIESIRSKIGNREIKGGYTDPVDLTQEKESEEEPSEDESKEEKDSKDKKEDEKEQEDSFKGEEAEDTEETEDPELAEVDVKLLTDQHLAYITPGNGVEEAQEYMAYLLQEKGFKILTYPVGSEGEIPREAPKATEAAEDEEEEQDEKTNQEDGEEESEAFIPPEEGYYIAAMDNKSTAAEGEATQIKRVRLQYDYNSYTLRLSTANGVVSDLIPPEPEEEKKRSKSSGFSMSSAIETLQAMPREQLQLPKPTVEYEMTPIQGRVVLEGIDFYNIRAYEEGPEDTLVYGGTYYVSSDGKSIYKYDEMIGNRTLISGEDILAQAQQDAEVLSGNQ